MGQESILVVGGEQFVCEGILDFPTIRPVCQGVQRNGRGEPMEEVIESRYRLGEHVTGEGLERLHPNWSRQSIELQLLEVRGPGEGGIADLILAGFRAVAEDADHLAEGVFGGHGEIFLSLLVKTVEAAQISCLLLFGECNVGPLSAILRLLPVFIFVVVTAVVIALLFSWRVVLRVMEYVDGSLRETGLTYADESGRGGLRCMRGPSRLLRQLGGIHCTLVLVPVAVNKFWTTTGGGQILVEDKRAAHPNKRGAMTAFLGAQKTPAVPTDAKDAHDVDHGIALRQRAHPARGDQFDREPADRLHHLLFLPPNVVLLCGIDASVRQAVQITSFVRVGEAEGEPEESVSEGLLGGAEGQVPEAVLGLRAIHRSDAEDHGQEFGPEMPIVMGLDVPERLDVWLAGIVAGQKRQNTVVGVANGGGDVDPQQSVQQR